MSTSDSLKAQKTLLQKSPDLLDKRDSYGETVLHKAVRSENVACLDAVLTMLHKNGRLAAVMETRNKPFGETPLLVAVKMQNLDMVRRLLKKGADIFAKDAFGKSASVLAMDKGRGNFDVFLEIMKAMLRRGKTEDPDLEAEIEETQKITKSPIEEAFRKIYKDIKEKKIKNPDKLDAREYRRYVVEFLDLVSKKRDTLKQQDIKRVRQLLKEAPGLICSKMDDSYSGKKKSAIQLCIENNGNPALFSILIDTVPQQSVVRVSRGLGDYMICAVRNIRPEIIELLLAKSYGGFVPSWIMGTGNYLSPTESIDGKTSNPVAQFIKTPALWKASEDGTLTRLAKPLLSYYSSQYTNGNYASSILEAALEQENSEKLLLLLYKYKGFSAVHKIGDKPLESIMLEKNYMKALQTSIEMGMLDKQWVTADTNRIESFQNLLESRSDDTASKEIIEILKKHGIYREKTADDAK